MTKCPVCGIVSPRSYRCPECGKDLTDVDDDVSVNPETLSHSVPGEPVSVMFGALTESASETSYEYCAPSVAGVPCSWTSPEKVTVLLEKCGTSNTISPDWYSTCEVHCSPDSWVP